MGNLLPLISMVAGIGAGTLALVTARRQPEKAAQMRRLSVVPFGMALLMAVLLFV